MPDKIARRRMAHFGWLYGYDSWKIEPVPAIPEFLHGLRERAAALVMVGAEELVETLVTEYPPGAAIGWHRDAPAFAVVVAISLLSWCRLRLREGSSGRARASLVIEPRSVYTLRGQAGSRWQHSISPTKATRYSITFRTLRSTKAE
jgi:alkylated DNA repair dioxygenase AlkB